MIKHHSSQVSRFRDDGTWNFTVPSAGFWILQVDARLSGKLTDEEILPVQMMVDGVALGRGDIIFQNNQPGSLRMVTSCLTAGSHELKLFFDNYMARRSVVVTAISILSPASADLDGNGCPDGLENLAQEDSSVSLGNVVESHVSPAFIEGRSRALNLFELRTRHEGPASTLRQADEAWSNGAAMFQASLDAALIGYTTAPGGDRSAAGEVQPVNPGPGHGTWFTGLPLHANQATGYTAFFENGAFAQAGVVVWRPLNLFDATEITIPVGSELLMGAWTGEWGQ